MLLNIKGKKVRSVILNMSDREDRRNNIMFQLKSVGENIDEYYIQYATRFPYNGLISAAFVKENKGKFTKADEYDCSRNHYSIIKTSYDLGYDYVVVMEDDIQFNSKVLGTYIDAIPEDFDLLQFGGFTVDKNIDNVTSQKETTSWIYNDKYHLWTTSCYALSRKGMEYYISFMNQVFCVADMPLYMAAHNLKLIKPYIASTPLVIQADKGECLSDIRNNDNDTIDYNNQNRYEASINKKEDYFPYITKIN